MRAAERLDARHDSHATRSSRSSGGSSTSACSRNDSTKERKAARLVTGSSTTTEPSASSSHHVVRARRAAPPSPPAGRRCAPGRGPAPRRRAPRCPAPGPGRRWSGGSNGGPSASVDLAVDAVEPVVALLVPEVVVAGEVPAAPLELEAVRVDRALLVAVAEAHRACGSTTAPNRRARLGSAGSGATCTPRSRAPSVTRPPELQQALGGRAGPRPARPRRPGGARPAPRW